MTLPSVLQRPPAVRPSIRHRRPVREPNRFVVPIIIIGIIALIMQMYWMQEHWARVARRDDHTPLDMALIDKLKARILTVYECEYCLGSGSLDDPDIPGERIMCTICQGVGYNTTRRYTEDDRMCIACGGMGRRYGPEGEAQQCERCKGRGMVEIYE